MRQLRRSDQAFSGSADLRTCCREALEALSVEVEHIDIVEKLRDPGACPDLLRPVDVRCARYSPRPDTRDIGSASALVAVRTAVVPRRPGMTSVARVRFADVQKVERSRVEQ